MAPFATQGNHAAYYYRDSAGVHEQAPLAYFKWASENAKRRGLILEGTTADVERLIRQQGGHVHDVFIDCGVKGNQLSRPALDALRRRIESDPQVTHLYVHHRDRLARPDHAVDGVHLELSLLRHVSIIYHDREVPRSVAGARQELGPLLSSVSDFYNSGEFRPTHSAKMIRARIELAIKAFSAGGKAPYGFRRALYRGDILVRHLADGEVVRQYDHNVRWVLGDKAEIDVLTRMLKMLLDDIPANQIARIFNSEGIPSPGAGSKRRIRGVLREVSGTWNQRNIRSLADHPLLRGIMTNGRRSMGDCYRFSVDGPRPLRPEERIDENRVREIKNAPDQIISVSVKDRLLSEEDAATLDLKLQKRSETQRGKPRSRTPGRNPLGARCFDMNCGWPMYRQPSGTSYRYLCGRYMQSSGSHCTYNCVNGEQAVQFGLAVIRQHILHPAQREELCRAIRLRVESAAELNNRDHHFDRLQRALAQVNDDISAVTKNLARAKTDDAYQAIEDEFEKLREEQSRIQTELHGLENIATEERTTQQLAEDAIGNIDRIAELAADEANLPHVEELFRRLDVKLFLKFTKMETAKRSKGVIAGGVITLEAVS